MKLYRIKNANTGLYSLGSGNPRWNGTGKIWKGVGQLKNHLNIYREIQARYQYRKESQIQIPEEWLIEEYDLNLKSTILAKDL